MNISREQIQQLGSLARLELTEQEIALLSDQLPKIVEYVGHLQTVDTTSVVEADRPATKLRDDEARPSPAAEAILAQAPERSGPSWKVDAVFS